MNRVRWQPPLMCLLIVWGWIGGIALQRAPLEAADHRPPNVILIMTDDME